MQPTPGTNFVIALIALVAIGMVTMLVYKVAVWTAERSPASVKHFASPRRADMSSRDGSEWNDGEEYVPEPEPQRSIAALHMNHVEPDLNRSLNPAELHLNADEVAAVARMIEHKMTAAKPSKSSTIQSGFGVSRGGSQAYLRASAIYDALFGAPSPAVQYRTPDGGVEPPSHPVTGRTPMRTHAR